MVGKKSWKLANKLNLLTISIILLTAASLVLLMYRFQFRQGRQDLIKNNGILAGMVATNAEFGIYTEDRESLASLLDSLSLNRDIVAAVVVDSRRRTLASSSFRDKGSPLSEKTVEFLVRQVSGPDAGRDFAFQDDGDSISLIVPVLSPAVSTEGDPFLAGIPDRESDAAIGYVVLRMDTFPAQQRLRNYLYGAILSTLLILGIGIALTLSLTRRIFSPLVHLGEAARKVAAGKFEQTVETSGDDEVAELSRSFQEMVVNINTYRRQVDERTGELVEANRRMEEEINQRQKVEAQLLHSQKMEAIGHLAGGVAHDLNNILMAITSFGTLLQLELEETSTECGYVEEIMSSAERASQLTRNLLTFSRKQAVSMELLDLNKLVGGVSALLSRLIGEHITVEFAPFAQELRIVADQGQVEQVIVNLATNARDAMPTGGAFSIDLERRVLDENFAKMHGWGEPGEYALLSVSDSGTGMDSETRQKIFEPFYTTKDVDKGTGLGLSIVYGIVKQHGGYIDVYSEPGKGTRFIIYFPLDTSAGIPEAGKSEAVNADMLRGSETILFAEDENAVRDSLGAILVLYGYRVIEARNGAEAVKSYKEHDGQIDLLLFDIMMPVKNGKEAYEEIRACGGKAKAVFLSGFSEKVLPPELAVTGDVPLISKPIDPLELLARIRELLDGVSGGREVGEDDVETSTQG